MKRREICFLVLGLGDDDASYFVLRWTSPGEEGPKPGGSR
jgi:hypothetical protein